MDFREKGRVVLGRAEAGLRSLMGEAAAAGDYGAVMELAAWARRLGEMAGDERAAGGWGEAATGKGEGAAKEAKGQAGGASGKAIKGGSGTGYPKFLRQGESLVKVGWSKRLREEYSHKAPWRSVAAVVEAVGIAGAGGRMFTPEEFVPVREGSDQSEVPVYQVYVTLAWLKDLGLVVAHGRSGYTLRGGGGVDLMGEVKGEWERVVTTVN